MYSYKLKYKKNNIFGYLNFVLPDNPRTCSEVRAYCEVNSKEKFLSKGLGIFGVFLQCREKAEKEGIQIICAGSREDAWGSGAYSNTGYSVMVTLYDENEAVVDVFSECEDDLAVTVEQQKR